MIRKRFVTISAQSSGRVDSVASSMGEIARPVFSLPSVIITVNGCRAKKSQKVKVGDTIAVEWDEEIFEGVEAEDIPLDVLYEDDQILVINKAQGMVVHPGAGVHSGTLANALLSRYGEDFSTGDDDSRPGIVHRLDKDTSGVMIVARTAEAQRNLQQQFSTHTAVKHYAAIVRGAFSSRSLNISSRIERDPRDRKRFRATTAQDRGRNAETDVTVAASDGRYSLLDVRIHTGRTHQIRVHLSSVGHPVLGDPVYSSRDRNFPDATLMLHSAFLSVRHPETGRVMTFRAPLPQRFYSILSSLGLSEAAACFQQIDVEHPLNSDV